MSLVSSRLSLIHRCTIERDANEGSAGDDGWQDSPDWQTHLSDLACRFWSKGGGEIVVYGDSVVATDQTTVIVPLGTDVTETDRIASISYRGETIADGPLGIREVHTRKDHIQLILLKVD